MAAGVAVTVAPTLLVAGASTDIQPSTSTAEWIVHNVYIPNGKQCKIYRGDGTNWVEIDTITGSLLAFYFHVTYTQYMRIHNVDCTDFYVSYDGITSA